MSIDAICAKFGIGISAVFVPWSQSRNKDEKDERGNPRKSLNWKVTIQRNGKDILTSDYSAGIGHCPAYKTPQRMGDCKRVDNMANDQRINFECENGRKAGRCADTAISNGWYVYEASPKSKIEPSLADVIASLTLDSSVLDYSTFEEWASDIGYDSDSRKGEAIYRLCLSHALALRNALGESILEQLRQVCQDY